MTHLHKTSHKSPNIKWQKIAFYLKMSKNMLFFVCIKTTFFGQDSLKIFVFHIILLGFSSISSIGYFESYLNDVKIWFFCFKGHFLIIISLKI